MIEKVLDLAILRPLLRFRDSRLDLVEQTQPVIVQPRPSWVKENPKLSELMARGRQFHELARGDFVTIQVEGYYAYERSLTYRTCAIAAAYAGAFGSNSIERPDFSYSMAVSRLAEVTGLPLWVMPVVGPPVVVNGKWVRREQLLLDEIQQLVDINRWTRQGVVDWLRTIGL